MRLFLPAISASLITLAAGCVGAAGPPGPAGADGADGTDGRDGVDARVPDPVDTHFAFAVTNNGGVHRGVDVLGLDFDGTAASATTVVSRRVASPPRLDGHDGGLAEEWGGFESAVAFDTGSGRIGIVAATLRSVYDDGFIYFFAQWTETTGDGAEVGASTSRRRYTYDGTGWTRSGDEDRAFFAFPIDDPGFATGGCSSACHGTTMAAPAGALWDVWHWKAARTGPSNSADDEWWDDGTFSGRPDNGRNYDAGGAAAFEPGSATLPAYMPAIPTPGASAVAGPVWVWNMAPFDPTLGWVAGDYFPGVFNQLPWGSRGDVTVVSRFDDVAGTWTLEIKRARRTGNGDDVAF